MKAAPLLISLLIAANAPAQDRQPQTLDATGSTAPAPTTLIPREGCVTAECHPGIKKRPHLHGPVYVNACDSCHGLTDAATHAFEPLRERNETCGLCHVVETPADAHMHEPFAEGDCLACHDPHGGAEIALLRGENYAESCMACHEDVTGAHNVVHGPVAAGACGACHEPHASKTPRLLVAEGRELCLRCHVTTGFEIDTMPLVHEPAEGDCLVCHDPHATDNPAILTEAAPDLCTTCHSEIGVTMESATTQHDAVTTERSCLNCHASHATSHAGLLRGETQALCFECHDREIELEGGGKLANMKDLIENHKSLHGAIAQDSCVACHEIHGGGHRRLLTNEYPSDLYYPFSENAYALCFGCHDRQLALLSRTDDVTAFRNGDMNLHYVHVNRDEKGRTCSVCHDAHASDAERHIRKEIPFGPGGWMLPINYERLDEGGRCGPGCHQSFEYNRQRPLEYPPIDDAGAWKGENLVPGVPAEQPRKRKRN